MKKIFLPVATLFISLSLLNSCSQKPEDGESTNEMTFESIDVTDKADLWWAKTLADVNNDGLVDLVVQNANGSGGWLGWLEANTEGKPWEVHVVVDSLGPNQRFAAGDLETGDFDGDGDVDLLGVIHPGEWTDADAKGEVYWFENPTWKKHYIGEVKNALKDVSLADFNKDGRLDICFMSFAESNFRLYEQQADGSFKRTVDKDVKNLHEGMDAADIDGDGNIDVTFNGYFFKNGGANGKWELSEIDSMWHNQTGDWSRNATKVAAKDIDGDGKAEIFMSHSERSGYPLVMYKYNGGNWQKEVILDSLTAGHNMQIYDMDLDGRLDIVTGVNFGRAVNLGVKEGNYPLYVILNKKDGWKKKEIANNGTYNILVADMEGDGDMDLYRYPSHDSNLFNVFVNQVK